MTAPFDGARLEALLGDESFVRRIVVRERVDSTNDEVRRLAASGEAAGTVVIAEEQTAGRGRLGRRWHSAPRVGLYLSVLLRYRGPAALAPRLTIAAAVAAGEAARSVAGVPVELEWPNDLVVGGRKVAGILTEIRGAGGTAELVVGAGFNVDQTAEAFPPDLRGRATSLRLERGGRILEREALAAVFLARFGDLVARLERDDWPSVAAAWEALSPDARGRRVRVRTEEGGPSIEGRTDGLAEDGALRIVRQDGSLFQARQAGTIETREPG